VIDDGDGADADDARVASPVLLPTRSPRLPVGRDDETFPVSPPIEEVDEDELELEEDVELQELEP
jgi:hypothetical protein